MKRHSLPARAARNTAMMEALADLKNVNRASRRAVKQPAWQRFLDHLVIFTCLHPVQAGIRSPGDGFRKPTVREEGPHPVLNRPAGGQHAGSYSLPVGGAAPWFTVIVRTHRTRQEAQPVLQERQRTEGIRM
ncbi:hypothetical protein Save01_05332 [Streptomyces avermitilis]